MTSANANLLALPILLSTLGAAACSWLLLDLLGRRNGSASLGRRLLLRSRLSLSATVLLAGLSWWALELGAQLGFELPRSGEQVRNALIAVGLMWTLLRCKGVLLRHVQDHQGLRPAGSSPYLLDLTNKLLSVGVVLIGALASLRLLGVSAGVLFAASGFSAAALAFGARTLIENLLSGVMLYVNRPFVVGDQVAIPELTLQGTVTRIGAYYTELLTPDRQPLYIPNAVFASQAVINARRRQQRELVLELLLRPQDHGAIAAITGELQAQLAQIAGVEADLPQRVHAVGFEAGGLRLRLQCFCSSDLDGSLALQQQLLLAMAAAIERHGAALAQPLPGFRSAPDGAGPP
ncbi:MAG: mechanosensitive ion channel domain-containing protein [Cyanobacteriota bacterium]|nr:mechanosensitive ion channel domain-containing protein [Cyanobacteriota bacterium]